MELTPEEQIIALFLEGVASSLSKGEPVDIDKLSVILSRQLAKAHKIDRPDREKIAEALYYFDHSKDIHDWKTSQLKGRYFIRADQLISLMEGEIEQAWSKGYDQASLNYTSKGESDRIEQAKRDEAGRISRWIAGIEMDAADAIDFRSQVVDMAIRLRSGGRR